MTTTSAAHETTVGFTLAAFARNSPQVAITYSGGEWTYGQLLDRVHRMARALAAQGLKRGDVVALATGADPDTFALKFAANALGCAVWIIYDDLGPSLLTEMLSYVEPTAVVFIPGPDDDHLLAAVEQMPGTAALALGPHPDAVNLADSATAQSGEPVTVRAQPQDLSSIRLTGGSTGTPKGIPHTFALPVYYSPAALQAWNVTQLLCTAVGHLGGQLAEVVLTAGGRVVLHGENAFDPGHVLESIERERIGFIWMQPAMLHQLLDHPALESADTSSLRSLMITGGPTTPERMAQAVNRFGPIISSGYGTCEIGQITMLSPAEHQHPELLNTVGRPVPGVEVSIRDIDDEPLATGRTGEIWVRGPGLMSGYYKLPELTAQVLRDGWLHTGDLGFLDGDGYLSVVGRSKDTIVGVRETVYPAQIEKVLNRHPRIQQSAVFGVTVGAVRDEKIAAAVVPKASHQLSEHEVADWVRAEMGGAYAPEVVLVLPEMPTISSGKPDRTALRHLAADGR
ncbi:MULTISPECIES: class I adenylate-forming enzyme family protein [unclassified Nocardia]|uniref:class I adenylate-forming enzyme family protein n=1 Tax=unclassified Nocardia TaxID=2637762 RepID=UPI001CE3E098|nr:MULTISPECIES: AMP-binding protein [unclassified Nocardia]